jgi:hypothetical protein
MLPVHNCGLGLPMYQKSESRDKCDIPCYKSVWPDRGRMEDRTAQV